MDTNSEFLPFQGRLQGGTWFRLPRWFYFTRPSLFKIQDLHNLGLCVLIEELVEDLFKDYRDPIVKSVNLLGCKQFRSMALQNTDLIKFVTYPYPIPNKFIILDHSWIRCQLCICAQVRSFMSLIAADIFTIERKWKSTGAEYEGRRAATPAGKRCIGWVAKVELEKRNMGLGCTCSKTTLHYGYLFHGNIRLHSIFL